MLKHAWKGDHNNVYANMHIHPPDDTSSHPPQSTHRATTCMVSYWALYRPNRTLTLRALSCTEWDFAVPHWGSLIIPAVYIEIAGMFDGFGESLRTFTVVFIRTLFHPLPYIYLGKHDDAKSWSASFVCLAIDQTAVYIYKEYAYPQYWQQTKVPLQELNSVISSWHIHVHCRYLAGHLPWKSIQACA